VVRTVLSVRGHARPVARPQSTSTEPTGHKLHLEHCVAPCPVWSGLAPAPTGSTQLPRSSGPVESALSARALSTDHLCVAGRACLHCFSDLASLSCVKVLPWPPESITLNSTALHTNPSSTPANPATDSSLSSSSFQSLFCGRRPICQRAELLSIPSLSIAKPPLPSLDDESAGSWSLATTYTSAATSHCFN
jgi:hypothetical protein